MFKAFDLKGLDESFISSNDRAHFIESGRKATDTGKASVRQTLTTIVANSATLDGQKMQDGWFPQVEADVFLSHSHRNEDDILMLAGWLKERFGLKVFVDSAIWGYAGELLKMIDDEYCRRDSETYSYQLRNESTSHVHMMLMTALQMMIHKTECLIFVNTPQSIEARQVVTAKTYSPWIYAELTMAAMVEEIMPGRFKSEELRINAKGFYKKGEEKPKLSILHTIRDLRRLRPIDCELLRKWHKRCDAKGQSALDTLYEIVSV